MTEITDGDIHVFVYRTGLLSAVGHDLRLSMQRFRIEYGGGEVTGRFWPESFEVDGAVEDGELEPDALSESDRSDICSNISEDVLETDRYPEIRVQGEYEERGDATWHVAGELEMVGVRERVATEVRRRDGRFQTAVELSPSRWGIEPYRALMGALKLKDHIRIEFDLPAEGEP